MKARIKETGKFTRPIAPSSSKASKKTVQTSTIPEEERMLREIFGGNQGKIVKKQK